MAASVVSLLLLSFALAWSVSLRGGVVAADWSVTLLLVGCASLLAWLLTERRRRAPPLNVWLRSSIFLFSSYLILQILPLPIGLLHVLSPARAALVGSLAPLIPGIASAPLSVNVPAAVLGVFTILGYIATFLLVRDLSWHFSARPWTSVVPLIVIAGLEAAIGMYQVFVTWPGGRATGTYTNYDHFSGFLELVLSLAVLYGFTFLIRRKAPANSSVSPAIIACSVWAIAAFILLAIIYSLSRAGFFVAACILFVIGVLSIGARKPSPGRRWAAVGFLACLVVFIVIALPPDQLIERFATLASTERLSSNARVFMWKETLPVISEFRWFGCGLGGFEPAFLKYQAVASNFRIDFAHNDYLQYLAELGIIGFALLTAILAGILAQILRGLLRGTDEDRRLLLIGCAGAFLAISLHSLVDFNMYVPANAMTLAWIAGIGSANAFD